MLNSEQDYKKCLAVSCSLCGARPGKPCDRYGGMHVQRGREPYFMEKMGIFLGIKLEDK